MDYMYLRPFARGDAFLNPIIMTVVTIHLDIDAFLIGNGFTQTLQPHLFHTYIVVSVIAYLCVISDIIISCLVKKDIRRYIKWRVSILLVFAIFLRTKEIISPPRILEVHIPIEFAFLVFLNLSTGGLLQNYEFVIFRHWEEQGAHNVFSREWGYGRFHMSTMAYINFFGDLAFLLAGLNIYMRWGTSHYISLSTGTTYGVAVHLLLLVGGLTVCNHVLYICGVRMKSLKYLAAYYNLKQVICLSFRLLIAIIMLTERYNGEIERIVIYMAPIPYTCLVHFQSGSVMRLITYVTLEKTLPVGKYLPYIYVPEVEGFDFFSLSKFDQEFRGFIHSIRIPRWRVAIRHDKIVGEGNYSKTCEGYLRVYPCTIWRGGRRVAIKIDKCQNQMETYRALASELKIMSVLGRHPYLVQLYGVWEISHPNELGIVTGLCENGELLHYLWHLGENANGKVNDDDHLNLFLGWLWQISSGMGYLSDKMVVHGDLAGRNILLTKNLTCKIADFGMSLKLYEYQTYAKNEWVQMPIRWMAPESLTDLKFSTKSDVWSYGVVMWEVFSYGLMPWSEMYDGTPSFILLLQNGTRLEKPAFCPMELYDRMMMRCWSFEPNSRPTFQALMMDLKDFRNMKLKL